LLKVWELGLGSLTLSTIPGLNQSYANTDLSKLTSYEDVTTYNNYYEFGTGKSDPYNKSQSFKTRPWNISIEGEVEEPINFSIEEILTTFNSEETSSKIKMC
jgi:sulfoxide reductase catalytic subunit YedY